MAVPTLTYNATGGLFGNTAAVIVTGGSESDRITFEEFAAAIVASSFTQVTGTFDEVLRTLDTQTLDISYIFGTSDSDNTSPDCFVDFTQASWRNPDVGADTGNQDGATFPKMVWNASCDARFGVAGIARSDQGAFDLYLKNANHGGGFDYYTPFNALAKIVCHSNIRLIGRADNVVNVVFANSESVPHISIYGHGFSAFTNAQLFGLNLYVDPAITESSLTIFNRVVQARPDKFESNVPTGAINLSIPLIISNSGTITLYYNGSVNAVPIQYWDDLNVARLGSNDIPLVRFNSNNAAGTTTVNCRRCGISRTNNRLSLQANNGQLIWNLMTALTLGFQDPLGNAVLGEIFLERASYSVAFNDFTAQPPTVTKVEYADSTTINNTNSHTFDLVDKTVAKDRFGGGAWHDGNDTQFIASTDRNLIRYSFHLFGKVPLYRRLRTLQGVARESYIEQILDDESVSVATAAEVSNIINTPQVVYDNVHKWDVENKGPHSATLAGTTITFLNGLNVTVSPVPDADPFYFRILNNVAEIQTNSLSGVLRTTGTVTINSGVTFTGSIIDSNGDATANISANSLYDTLTMYPTAADLEADTNEIGSGFTIRYQSATYGGQNVFIKAESSTQSVETQTGALELPAGEGVHDVEFGVTELVTAVNNNTAAVTTLSEVNTDIATRFTTVESNTQSVPDIDKVTDEILELVEKLPLDYVTEAFMTLEEFPFFGTGITVTDDYNVPNSQLASLAITQGYLYFETLDLDYDNDELAFTLTGYDKTITNTEENDLFLDIEYQVDNVNTANNPREDLRVGIAIIFIDQEGNEVHREGLERSIETPLTRNFYTRILKKIGNQQSIEIETIQIGVKLTSTAADGVFFRIKEPVLKVKRDRSITEFQTDLTPVTKNTRLIPAL